ncbi:hypothetical protein [Streptococcus sp.]|uniref:hypothetical protein n=1 Tax=Streptococcus sp. TaxID=1306 RepID=UPI00391B1EB9
MDGDLATITVNSRHIVILQQQMLSTTLLRFSLTEAVDIFAGMNQANTLDAEFKKVQTLVSYFLYRTGFGNLLVSYSDVPARLNETPRL